MLSSSRVPSMRTAATTESPLVAVGWRGEIVFVDHGEVIDPQRCILLEHRASGGFDHDESVVPDGIPVCAATSAERSRIALRRACSPR